MFHHLNELIDDLRSMITSVTLTTIFIQSVPGKRLHFSFYSRTIYDTHHHVILYFPPTKIELPILPERLTDSRSEPLYPLSNKVFSLVDWVSWILSFFTVNELLGFRSHSSRHPSPFSLLTSVSSPSPIYGVSKHLNRSDGQTPGANINVYTLLYVSVKVKKIVLEYP